MSVAEFVALSVRFSLSVAFALAAIAKLGRRDQFENAVERFGMVPKRLAAPIALWLPRFEMLCAVLLGLGVLTSLVAASLAVALVVFSSAISINLLRGREIDCGCFGRFGKAMTWLSVGRNLLLLAMAITVAVIRPGELSVVSLFGARTAGAQEGPSALIVGTLLTLVALLIAETRGLWRSAAGLRRDPDR